jgi:uncharacterized protein YjdB
MKKLLFCIVWVLSCITAYATTFTVNASQSTATIQGVISGASIGDTVSFSAGTYSLTAQLTLKCGVTYTGPAVTPATAILNGSGSGVGQGNGLFTLFSNSNLSNPCTQQTTIEYLAFQAVQTGIFVQTSYTNLLIQHNQCISIPGLTSQTACMVFESGNTTSNTASILTNSTITNNQLGDSNSCISPTNVMADTDSPEDFEGACNGIVFFTSINGLTITNNHFLHVSEGVHINCPNYANQEFACEPPGGALTQNIVVEFNDFAQIHRIPWEEQPQQSTGHIFEFNSFHDWLNPYFGSFGVSFACCYNGTTAPFFNASNNVILFNVVPLDNTSGGRYGFGMEAAGHLATYNNELLQAGPWNSSGSGMAYGCGPVASMSNNTVQGIGWQGQYIVNESGGHFPCGTDTTPASLTGNVTGTTVSTVPSVAPTISPSGGARSSPLTVTLTDAGYTSGSQPLGNTSIWYTTDGTTPVPGQGTATVYTLPFNVSLPATVKAVGMWGTGANPTSYASGYGFVPSAVVTANYVASGGVTLSSVSIAPTASISTLSLGSTVQMIVTCHYSDGSTTGCNTTDSHGNSVGTWSSSNGNVAVSSSGLATATALGSAVITAVVSGFTTSPGATLTVNASPLTLSSVSLAAAGGASSINAGATNQLIPTCHYSDGTTTLCNTMDSHGNQAGSYNSSAPTVATVTNSGGLVTGVSGGSTSLTASVVPAPSSLGTALQNVTGFTNNGFINEIYGVTGTSAGNYTPGNCHIILPATSWVAGKLWTCLLVLGTPTTQNVSALCSNSYTTTGTSWPGGDLIIPMTSCPALPPDQGYWVGSTTNQTTANPAQGFSNCNGSCSGAPPAFGSGTYGYWYVANTFGNYTALPATLSSGGTLQVSQYIELTTTAVTSGNLALSVTAPLPSLLSAYLTASSSSMIVGATMQMAAKCHYSSGPDQDCTVADIYGDAVSAWASSDPTKATIGAVGSSNPGLVTAVAAGAASITATIGAGTTSSAYPITVSSPAVTLTGVSLSLTGGVTGLFVGATNQLKATCTYSDGSSDDCTTSDAHGNLAHSYLSSAPGHATVNTTSGLVTGVAPGSTTFTAVAGSFTSNPLPLAVFPVLSGIYTITVSGPVKFSGTVRF